LERIQVATDLSCSYGSFVLDISENSYSIFYSYIYTSIYCTLKSFGAEDTSMVWLLPNQNGEVGVYLKLINGNTQKSMKAKKKLVFKLKTPYYYI
ncbi:hypothetical protein A4A49_53740, partial [Nicotiana attenuata]